MNALILALRFFCIIVVVSQFNQATRTLVAQPQMKMNESATLNQTQQYNHTKLVGTCSYLVTIYTSCVSPYNAKGQIDIKFGDADTLAVARGLEKFARFEPCTMSEFELTGECINKICRVRLIGKGRNGWIPEKVTIDDYNHPPTTFSYDSVIPEDILGYGANYC